MVPWAHEVREQWKSLRFPLWNSHAVSGYPLLANGQSAAFSPLRLLALPLPLGQSFTAEAAMKLLIALTFTFLFCRRRGYSEIASAVGAMMVTGVASVALDRARATKRPSPRSRLIQESREVMRGETFWTGLNELYLAEGLR